MRFKVIRHVLGIIAILLVAGYMSYIPSFQASSCGIRISEKMMYDFAVGFMVAWLLTAVCTGGWLAVTGRSLRSCSPAGVILFLVAFVTGLLPGTLSCETPAKYIVLVSLYGFAIIQFLDVALPPYRVQESVHT